MTTAYDLGGVMRMLFGIGTSMGLQGMMRAILAFIEDFRARSE